LQQKNLLVQTGTQLQCPAWWVSPETKKCRNLNLYKMMDVPSKTNLLSQVAYISIMKTLKSKDKGSRNLFWPTLSTNSTFL
jgi:hypothetical protein